jgi:putative membrane-bound dehydrogenase-like protein
MTIVSTRTLRTAGVAAVLLSSLVTPDARSRVAIAGHTLTVPDGFEIEVVAAPPLVERPIVADFDEEGRLYVTESSGSNDKVEKQLAEKPHRILRLEDTDGDGRFDRRVVFADRMMLPEGALWFDGSLYVAAPPSIWKLTDTDADGVADRREEWFQGRTLTGCANDLHGPYLGPDGWIYWTKGAFAEQTYERPGRAPLVTRAAHIFRRRPEGGAVEAVMTGGMDNPIDVAFTSTGERILTTTFLEHPQLGRRDAVLHAIYGGVYGKPHGVIDGHPRTGDLMPPLSHLGPAAPSGLTGYRSRAFGDDYRDSFFAALFNLHKVTRHALEPSGATFRSRDSDFVVSDSLDFHPTDVIEDADGSLLIVDTGAWYKLCCPTSQLAKPDVPGAIYRVRRRGAPAMADPRGRGLAWSAPSVDDLVARLADERPAVVARAIHLLGKQGARAVPGLATRVRTARAADVRREALWALTRIDAPEAREAVRAALADRDEPVRHTAAYAAGLWRDAGARPALLRTLASTSLALQRVAAEALGRIGDGADVPALLAAVTARADRTLEHSAIFALIEMNAGASTNEGLKSPSPHVRRAALIAVDQMPSSRLPADTVIPLLDSTDPRLKETAWWIAVRHPEWGDALARYFRPQLANAALSPTERADLEQTIARFGESVDMQQMLATSAQAGSPLAVRASALRAMAQSRPKTPPEPWLSTLTTIFAEGDAKLVPLAVAAARAAAPPKADVPTLRAALVALARDTSKPPAVRLDALAAAATEPLPIDAPLFALLRDSLDSSKPAGVRSLAASIIEKATLDRAQLQTLTTVLENAGPLELPRLLPAFDRGSDEALGLAMLAAVERARARGSVRADVLRPRLAAYPESVRVRGDALLDALDVDAAQQRRRLESLLNVMRDGDLRRGQVLFNSPRVACGSCHAIGYQGGKIGPDLTAIGQIRSERDLLEAIVFPSASFARGYESVVVTTTAGVVHSGVLRRELPDEVVVASGERDEARIPRAQIADMQPGLVSVMPAGFGDVLTRQELADLLAFLKATRWGAN